jgi:hypothetical protein
MEGKGEGVLTQVQLVLGERHGPSPDTYVCSTKAKGIRVLWGSKANCHNVTFWAPSFILADFGGLEDMVVKWLAQLVARYLLAGSPDKDYT